MSDLRLHGYYRSSASYRVRIALNLKQLSYAQAVHHLRKGEQEAPEYLRLNPQGLIPALETDGQVLTQSLAICEYLEETVPRSPLLPRDALARAKVRAFAQVIACDIHPIQNLKILRRLRRLGIDQAGVDRWAVQAIEEGLDACERLVHGQQGPYCFGTEPTLADICLVPQLYNARRFGISPHWTRLLEAEGHCLALPAFHLAAPEQQPDWE